MNISKTFLGSLCCALVLFCCLCVPVQAEHAVTYSPEQWPKRWSSAIRQQQSNRYPQRHEEQTLNDDSGETFSDEDLFLNSPEALRYTNRHRHRRGWGRHLRYENHDDQYRDRSYTYGARRMTNWSAPYQSYSYPPRNYLGYPGYLSPYAGYGLYGADPLLGYPGLGLGYPLLGPTLGSPYMGYPYLGYPGAGLGGPYIW